MLMHAITGVNLIYICELHKPIAVKQRKYMHKTFQKIKSSTEVK
ncbi:hypothetical protein MTsDn1_20190 [Alteromonas sp. MTD1]